MSRCQHMEPQCCGHANRDGSCCGDPVPGQCMGCEECQPAPTPSASVTEMKPSSFNKTVKGWTTHDSPLKLEYLPPLDLLVIRIPESSLPSNGGPARKTTVTRADLLRALAGEQPKANQEEPFVTRYTLGNSDEALQRAIHVEYVGGGKWAVRCFGACLNHDGRWEMEPMPSSRSASFLERCRYTSAQDAISAAQRSVKS